LNTFFYYLYLVNFKILKDYGKRKITLKEFGQEGAGLELKGKAGC